MSNLSIGLVTSPNEESKQLISLLEAQNIQVIYHILPEEIESLHIENESLNVWLLNVDDDHWHDNIDQLLDESEASIYFNEPGTLTKQSHPEYWCENLVSRLYELTGLSKGSSEAIQKELSKSTTKSVESEQNQPTKTSVVTNSHESLISDSNIKSIDDLSASLDELETSSVGLPSDIAAELVSELEGISPGLDSSIEESLSLDEELLSDQDISLDTNVPEISEKVVSEELQSLEESISAISDISEFVLDTEEINLELGSVEEVRLDNLIIEDVAIEKLDPETDVQESLNLDDALIEGIDLEQSALEIDVLDSLSESLRNEPNDLFDADISISEPIDDTSISIPEIDLQQQEILNDLSLDIGNSLELEIADEVSQQEIELVNEQDIDEPLNDSEEIDLSGFSLELMEEEKEENSTGAKAHYVVDESLVDQLVVEEDADGAEIRQEDVDSELDGLTLESMEEESTTGRAVYLEEEPEFIEVEEEATKEEALLDDGGLTLELNDDIIATTGRAQYVIDDEPKESEITETELSQPAEKQVDGVSSEMEASELNLDSMDEVQSDLLTSDNDILVEDELSLNELELDFQLQEMPSEIDSDEMAIIEIPDEMMDNVIDQNLDLNQNNTDQLSLDQELVSENLIEVNSAIEIDAVSNKNEEPVVEIPMLEESATGIDFEEVTEQQMINALTPCWVIGASLGGPAAVKRFLQSLPADINASFIVVQHIDENFLPVLADILTSSSNFQVEVANGSNSIEPGKIYLAPLVGKVIFLQDGSMLVDRSQKWSEPYSPCIDDVLDSVSVVYGDQCGTIIFSGMGQDGLRGSEKMRALGGKIWAQSVDSCANSSMPEAVINANLASVIAAPEILADRLVDYLNNLSEAI